MGKTMYSAEEVNQILFDITLEKAKAEEKLQKIEQIIKRTEGILELDNYTVQQIKEVLKDE